MYDAAKLAKLLTKNIMVYHDAAQYSFLEKNSIALVISSGYEPKIAKRCAKLIRLIYENYDKAQLSFEKKDFKTEDAYYKKAKELAEEMNNFLGAHYDNKVLVEIVYFWRHHKKVVALWKIFKNWNQKFRGNIINAILSTYYMVKAANCHDKRNKAGFEENFRKVYSLLVKSGPGKIPVLF